MGICISSAEEVQVGDENIRAHEGGNGKQVAPAPMPEKTQTGGNDHMTLRHLLADEMARETFYNYLKREFAEENLSFFMAADKVKTALPSELAKSAEKLTVSFLRPGVSNEINISDGLRKNIADLLDAGIKDNQSHKKLIEMLERAQNETLVLMAMGSFPRFLESDDYKQYLERKANGETGAVEIRGPTNTAVANGQLSVLDAKFTEILDKRVVERALSAGSWLSGLLASVENLPVCVSLSTARKTRLGFPLIYVNKYFEDTTGYSQSEIIGQNCRFLQKGKRDNDRSEQDSIDRLTKALRSATPVKVAITNYKKSGVAFRNLLAMKPIFDFNGNYSYVVGVQFDVTSPDASAASFVLADKLLKMLPDKVMVPSEEIDV